MPDDSSHALQFAASADIPLVLHAWEHCGNSCVEKCIQECGNATPVADIIPHCDKFSLFFRCCLTHLLWTFLRHNLWHTFCTVVLTHSLTISEIWISAWLTSSAVTIAAIAVSVSDELAAPSSCFSTRRGTCTITVCREAQCNYCTTLMHNVILTPETMASIIYHHLPVFWNCHLIQIPRCANPHVHAIVFRVIWYSQFSWYSFMSGVLPLNYTVQWMSIIESSQHGTDVSWPCPHQCTS